MPDQHKQSNPRFIYISESIVDAIAERGVSVLLAGYLVLAAGRQKRNLYSTFGGASIAKYLPIPKRRGLAIIEQLKQIRPDGEPEVCAVIDTSEYNAMNCTQYPEMHLNRPTVVLPRSEVSEGFEIPITIILGRNDDRQSKLQKIMALPEPERFVTLSTLLLFYRHYEPIDFTGCNPELTAWQVPAQRGVGVVEIKGGIINSAGDASDVYDYGYQGITNDLHSWLIPANREITARPNTIEKIGSGDAFFKAVGALTEFGVVRSALVVFSGDPLTDDCAVPLYTLYEKHKPDLPRGDYRKGLCSKTLTWAGLEYEVYGPGGEYELDLFVVVAPYREAVALWVYRSVDGIPTEDGELADNQERERQAYWRDRLTSPQH